MFAYNNAIADYAAVFPGAVYSPHDFRNEDRNGYEIVDETGTVPAAADGDGKYRLNLDQVPNEQIGVTITVNGDEREPIPYGETVAEGQVALSMETGLLEFHAADAGLEVVANYTGKGTAVTAFALNQFGKELAAAQTGVAALAAGSGIGTPDQRTYHVSATTGNDTSGNGSPLKPFATVTKALQAIAPLSTGTKAAVVISPGSYTLDVGVTGIEDPEEEEWTSYFTDKFVSLVGAGVGVTALEMTGEMEVLYFAGIRGVSLNVNTTPVTAAPLFINNPTGGTLNVGDCAITGTTSVTFTTASGGSVSRCAISVASTKKVTITGRAVNNKCSGAGSIDFNGEAFCNVVDITGNCALAGNALVANVATAALVSGTLSLSNGRGTMVGNYILCTATGSVGNTGSPTMFAINSGASGEELYIAQNRIYYKGTWDEPTNNGKVSVFYRLNCLAHVILESNEIDSSIIAFMDGHPDSTKDPNRAASLRPTTMINNRLRYVTGSTSFNNDSVAAVHRYSGGHFVARGNVIEQDSSGATATNFHHAAILIDTNGLSVDSTFDIAGDNKIFFKGPSGALDSGKKKCAIAIRNNGGTGGSANDPDAFTFTGEVKVENHDALMWQDASSALSDETWFKCKVDWYSVDDEEWKLNIDGTDHDIPSGGSFDPASPGAIGGTTPAAGTFTSLAVTGAITQSRLNVVSVTTSPVTLTAAQSGSVVLMSGSAGTLNFPPGAAGLHYHVIALVAGCELFGNGAEAFRYNPGTGYEQSGSIQPNSVYVSGHFVWNGTSWHIMNGNLEWGAL